MILIALDNDWDAKEIGDPRRDALNRAESILRLPLSGAVEEDDKSWYYYG